MASRLNLTLDDERSDKLSRMADRVHLPAGTLAKSMLSEAIDRADAVISENDVANAGPAAMTAILLGAPGFQERFESGMTDAKAGRTTPLEDLA